VKAIGDAFDDFNIIVYSLQFTRVYMVTAVVNKTIAIVIQSLSKFHKKLDITGYSDNNPGVKTLSCPARGFIIPYSF